MTLTRLGVIFLSALGLATIATIAWMPSPAGVVLSIFIGLGALGILGARSAVRGLQIVHQAPDVCFAGVRSRGHLFLTNRSRLFPIVVNGVGLRYVEAGLRNPLLVRLEGPWSLAPGQTTDLGYPLRPHRRGRLRFKGFEFNLAGVPSLVESTRQVPDAAEVLVYPRPAALRRMPPWPPRGALRARPIAAAVRRTGEEEFSGVRLYNPGDNPRHIHWRTSFKWPGQINVKEFMSPDTGEALIVLDTRRPKRGDRHWRLAFERATSAAAALWDSLDRQGVLASVRVHDEEGEMTEFGGRHQAREIYRSLALATPGVGGSPPGPPHDPRRAVFWLTANAEPPETPEGGVTVLSREELSAYFQLL